MPVKKRPRLEKTIFDEEFAQDRMDRRGENRVEEKIASEEMRRCFDILAWQMEQPIAGVFLEPVDWRALDLPLYPQIVKHPMDYGTIKQRLLTGQIPTPAKFAELVRLVYKNAMKFNQQGSQIYDITQKLSDEFEGNFECVKLEKPAPVVQHMAVEPVVEVNPYADLVQTIASLESRLSAVQEETAALKATYQTKAEEQAIQVQPHLRIEKFEVDYPRRPFTFEEKEALCLRMTQINDQVFAKGLLEVIQLEDSGQEVELDVENFDDETLHRIAEYLDSYQESLNPTSRYGYGDDEDYIESVRRKKKNKI
jgi:bromodomain-containing factor 1